MQEEKSTWENYFLLHFPVNKTSLKMFINFRNIYLKLQKMAISDIKLYNNIICMYTHLTNCKQEILALRLLFKLILNTARLHLKEMDIKPMFYQLISVDL